LAFTGSERVQANTLKEFGACYRSAGFKETSFYACYGLAESSLMVTGGHLDNGVITKKRKPGVSEESSASVLSSVLPNEAISCGKAHDAELLIVNVDSLKIMPDKNVGEVWVKSPSVAQGYWGQSELTEQVFRAYTFCSKGPYLRTGDIGYLDSGELIILGRLKEMIIINGRNYYPDDIENIIQSSSEQLRKGCGAVFSVELSGSEKLVVVQELNNKLEIDEREKLVDIISKKISDHYKIVPYEIILEKRAALPKTTSGKLKRTEIKKDYLKNQELPQPQKAAAIQV